MTCDVIIIRAYNTGYIDIEIDRKTTVFSKKSELNSWLLFAKGKGLTQRLYKRENNGDRIYCFS